MIRSANFVREILFLVFVTGWVAGVSGAPPRINDPPQSQVAGPGASITFQVSFLSFNLPATSQWRYEGTPIPGANGSSYTIAAVSVANAGKYDVVVSNQDGQVRSTPAYLTIGTFEALKSFSGSEGQWPKTGLVQGRDGWIYGTTLLGGAGTGGTLFRFNSNGKDFQVVRNLPGIYPESDLVDGGDGMLYFFGMPSGEPGTAFHRASKNGEVADTVATYSLQLGFPKGLMVASDGRLYFTVTPWAPGPYSDGSIESLNPITGGMGGLKNFNKGSFGHTEGRPLPNLLQERDGALYGFVNSVWWGEFRGGPYLFRAEFDREFKYVASLPAGTFPSGRLVQDNSGILYGISRDGGIEDKGKVFRTNPDGQGFEVLHEFTTATGGSFPAAGLTLGPGESLFGLTDEGGNNGAGVIFHLTKAGEYRVIHHFDWGDKYDTFAATLTTPMLLGRDGSLYGTRRGNGNGGKVFQLRLDGGARLPEVRSQPEHRIARVGETVSFDVDAVGGEPLFYRWRLNGSAAGFNTTTNSKLTLANVQLANAGRYQVLITNSYGAITSEVAVLTVPLVNLAPGRIVGWGNKTNGQLPLTATANAPLTNVVAIAASDGNSAAAYANGSVGMWGTNGPTWVLPGTYSNIVKLAAGQEHFLALGADGSLKTWGRNNFGQLNIPGAASNVMAITASDQFSAALRADGKIVAWGSRWRETNYVTVVPKAALGDVVDLSGRFALRSDGSVFSWTGDRLEIAITNIAALGNSIGARKDASVATWGPSPSGEGQVPEGLSNVVAVAAGGNHRLALRKDGSVAGWGWNAFAQTASPPGLKAVAIAASSGHSLAIAENSSVLRGVIQFKDVEPVNAFERDPSIRLTIQRVGGTAGSVSARVTTLDGSALAGKDYTARNSIVTFIDGQTSAVLSIPLLDDLDDDESRYFTATLSEAAGGATLGVATARVVINGTETQIGFEQSEYSVNETSGNLKVRLVRSGLPRGDVSVDVSTRPGSAGASDFGLLTNRLSWSDGELGYREFIIPISNDSVKEGDENFRIAVGSPMGTTPVIEMPEITATILDDESPPVVEFAETNYFVAEQEGYALVRLQRRGGAGILYTVSVQTTNGTAIAAEDYRSVSETIAFGKDDGIRVVKIPILDSYAIEGEESFAIEISGVAGGAALGANKAAFIQITDSGHSYEDLYGHGLRITYGGGTLQNQANVNLGVTVMNPSPSTSFAGFVQFLAGGGSWTTNVPVGPMEPNTPQSVTAALPAITGFIYATLYETINGVNVPQDSRAVFEVYFTGPPTGGVPVGEQSTAPGFAPPPKLVRVVLTGPSTIAGGTSGRFIAAGVFDNGVTNVNVAVAWRATLGAISSTGNLTTQTVTTNTPTTVTATVVVGGITQSASISSTILSPPKIDPSITWTPTAPTIVYGITLGAAQLNATANVAGSFTYDPPAGTKLNSGSNTVRAIFTPSNTATYNSVQAEKTIVVSKATASIVWLNPAAIFYGTPLGPTQLNAAGVPVEGTFTYTPASGTVLNVGIHALQATFVPANTNYLSKSSSVGITVNKAPQTISFTLPTHVLRGTSVTLGAQASSGMPVTYSMNGGGGFVATSVTLGQAGAVTISASQNGNANYEAAPRVEKSVVVVDPASMALTVRAASGGYEVVWPEDGGLFTLEVATALRSNATWTIVAPVQTIGTQRRHQFNPLASAVFFRLHVR